ncbi:MAG: energy-coupling factor transporter transmembrane protein EcfT [Microbacteriaceae bacterium]|nr:energy-coupling factor transporter transmembrane protein EcfT [Microbacteriaceae bacterium]
MIALYRPGTSLLHRTPAGLKVVLFMLVSLAITVAGSTPWALPLALVFVIVGYLLAGFGARELARQVFAVRWLVLFMLVAQIIFLPPLVAVGNAARVLAVVVLAALITLTTRIPALLDAIDRALRPLRRVGVNSAAVGLLLAMTITTIPVIAGFAATIREAQRARGAKLRLATFAVPLLVMSLKHSDDLADALAARGVE